MLGDQERGTTPDAQEREQYEVPMLMVLGEVKDFTLGSGNDTAELKTHYW